MSSAEMGLIEAAADRASARVHRLSGRLVLGWYGLLR